MPVLSCSIRRGVGWLLPHIIVGDADYATTSAERSGHLPSALPSPANLAEHVQG